VVPQSGSDTEATKECIKALKELQAAGFLTHSPTRKRQACPKRQRWPPPQGGSRVRGVSGKFFFTHVGVGRRRRTAAGRLRKAAASALAAAAGRPRQRWPPPQAAAAGRRRRTAAAGQPQAAAAGRPQAAVAGRPQGEELERQGLWHIL